MNDAGHKVFVFLTVLCLVFRATCFEPVTISADGENVESEAERRILAGGLRKIFDILDTDHNDLLSEFEVVSRLSNDDTIKNQLLYVLEGSRLSPNDCREIFEQLDKNGDGIINFGEFLIGADGLRGPVRVRAKKVVKAVIDSDPSMGLGTSRMSEACTVNDTEKCPMSHLHGDKPSLIFPGGKTRCINDTDQLYAFRVYPGSSDKLYLDFQGGGACFNEYTTMNQTMCKTDIGADPLEGVYNKSDQRNPFRSYTIVMVVYCSGDLHVGNTSRDYGGSVQKGYENAESAIRWTQENMDPHLVSLVIGGCSAGSLASQMWSPRLLRSFSYSNAVVLADSYFDIFPGRSQQWLLYDFGLCRTPLLSPVRKAQCEAGNLTAHVLFEDAMASFPRVTFAQVNSKFDKTQLYFHQAVAYTSGIAPELTNGSTYFAAVNRRIRRFQKHPNYVSFLTRHQQHCFTPFSDFYSVTASGLEPACKTGLGGSACDKPDAHATKSNVKLVDWARKLLQPKSTLRSECYGKRLPFDQWDNAGIDYCDAGHQDISNPVDLNLKLWGEQFGRKPVIVLHGGRTLSAYSGASVAGLVIVVAMFLQLAVRVDSCRQKSVVAFQDEALSGRLEKYHAVSEHEPVTLAAL